MATPGEQLGAALAVINWNAHVTTLLSDKTVADEIAEQNLRVALWAKQMLAIRGGNPALPFVREMETQGHYVAALLALALYKPAAASMRGMVEAALYFTYFESHPRELATLARGGYYVMKDEITEFHHKHTVRFSERQAALGFMSELGTWYSEISAIVHGQIPGSWHKHTALRDIKPDAELQTASLKMFGRAVKLVHGLFVSTIRKEEWVGIPKDVRELLLKGLGGGVRAVLDLPVA